MLFALLDLPVGLQSGKGLVPREGGKEEGGRGTTGGDLACGRGTGSQEVLFSSAGNVTLSTWSEKIYLKNDFLDEQCHLSKKAVCDCSSLLRYDTGIILQTHFGVSRAP